MDACSIQADANHRLVSPPSEVDLSLVAHTLASALQSPYVWHMIGVGVGGIKVCGVLGEPARRALRDPYVPTPP